MNLMVDTNIFIDVLTEREPFFQSSKEFLKLCEENMIHGFVSASSVTDIYYLIRRQLHSTELAYKSLGYVLDIVKILPVTNENVLDAFTKKASDFEDCLLATCAKSNKCNGIVTRNLKDFENFNIKLYTPENILEGRLITQSTHRNPTNKNKDARIYSTLPNCQEKLPER